MVAAYGLILPHPILTAPRLGCLNVHASLLPRWRGAAPIQRALLAGDPETGITIMQMEEGLDTGPILLQEAVPIASDATAAGLSAELAILGGPADGRRARRYCRGHGLSPRPQPQEGVTYAHKIGREDGRLDWRMPCGRLERRVRALDPWPGVYFESPARRERIRVLAAIDLPGPAGGAPGTVLDDSLTDRLRRGRSAPVAAAAAGPRAARRRRLSCAAFRSPPGRCCRAPLQADHRI